MQSGSESRLVVHIGSSLLEALLTLTMQETDLMLTLTANHGGKHLRIVFDLPPVILSSCLSEAYIA